MPWGFQRRPCHSSFIDIKHYRNDVRSCIGREWPLWLPARSLKMTLLEAHILTTWLMKLQKGSREARRIDRSRTLISEVSLPVLWVSRAHLEVCAVRYHDPCSGGSAIRCF